MTLLHFTLNGENYPINHYQNNYTLSYPCSTQTECWPLICNLPPGYYQFELFGASGGSNNNYIGYGGYSTGILLLFLKTLSYFYIGAQGITTTTSSAITEEVFNGGGNGHLGTAPSTWVGSGGGGTDIRLLSKSLDHRIIVAGGGGSGYFYSNYLGGNGGGLNCTKADDYSTGIGGYPGTQTSGGVIPSLFPGSFGLGGSAQSTDGNCGGGGGGFFGWCIRRL
jgi:hypothetical protein